METTNIKRDWVMIDIIIQYLAKWSIIASAFIYHQISVGLGDDGIISRGFDQMFSIGLLLVGIVVLAWHYYNDRKYQREVIKGLSDYNHNKDRRFEEMMRDHLIVSRDQVNTNRELCDSIKILTSQINQR